MANHKMAGHHLSKAATANKQQNVKVARFHIGHALNALNDRVSGNAPVAKPPVAPEIEGGEPDDSLTEEQGEAMTPQQPFQASAQSPQGGTGGSNSSALMARLRSMSGKK